MSTIYDIDYNQQAVELLPPDKRKPIGIKWVQSLLNPLQWVRDITLGTYRTGATASDYSAGTYNIYDTVLYNKSVYVSLIGSNTDAPTTNNWLKVQDNFIGVSERILYNGQIIVLEYALNKWFGTTFRQPDSLPDIYILNLTIPISFFRVGHTEAESSDVYTDNSSEYVINDYTLLSSPNFTIKIPSAVYTTLGASDTDRDNNVRSFVDKYLPAGLIYSITPY